MADAHLVLDHIGKRFGGIRALDGVSFAVERGACHALLGENGAGKSTLGKIVAGIHTHDSGRWALSPSPGRPPVGRRFRSPLDAAAAGVRIVHQEPAFCRNLSIAENLFLGRMPARGGFVRNATMARATADLLRRVGLDRGPHTPMAALSTGEEQMVQIAAALGGDAQLIIFDEPTSSLTDVEAERLFERIAELRRAGVTILYVSHRLEEIRRLCDAFTVLRDGRHVATRPMAGATVDALVRLMIGREAPTASDMLVAANRGDILLDVRGLAAAPRVADVSLQVRGGEVVGVAGLVGAGRSEVARAIFGIDRATGGAVRLAGRDLGGLSPAERIAAGLGFLPEDRQLQALILEMSCEENLTLAALPRLSRAGFIARRAVAEVADQHIAALRVRTPSRSLPVGALSGGNQQKIALARWLACRSRVLMLDEPTRGVDVAAKAEIHDIIRGLAAEGRGILLISSELPELLALATRVIVMRDGRCAGELPRPQATPEAVLRLMAGVEQGDELVNFLGGAGILPAQGLANRSRE